MEGSMAIRPFHALNKVIMPCQQEIKREHSEHLISPDMVTKEFDLHGQIVKREARQTRSGWILECIIPYIYHGAQCLYINLFLGYTGIKRNRTRRCDYGFY